MANVNNDIGEIVKKCKILLLDIEGTTTSISFVKDKLYIYAEENVKEFLNNQWENEEVKEVVAALRSLALEDKEKSVKGVVSIPGEESSKDEQIEGLVNNVKWQMLSDRKVGPLKQLQGLIWKLGYDKGDIKGHVYDDVKPALEQWKSTEGQKVYIYSSGSVQAQKLLFGQSVAGDLLPLIEGHFDTAVGAKQEAASYTAIAEKVGCKPEEILFLTDIFQEAEAARASGIQAALLNREGNSPLPAEAAASYPVLHSFDQLHPAVSNKRKTDDQMVEELPAKVPKTDVQDNVKTTAEAKETVSDAGETPATVETVAPEPVSETAEPEKMEVEETAEKVAEIVKPEVVVEKSPVQVETVVEEVTDAMDADVPMCDVKPVVEETDEKTEEVETVKLEVKPEENGETAKKPKEPAVDKKQDAPIVEETPAVITEIEEVTGNLNEVADIIEDLVPVVEEPPSEEMEELKNVGEVLEKECDEILSKVQDVTNLDSIPIKPMLNTITEETMETENTDSNDIVDRILDTEMELGLKPGEDIDLNTVQEITDPKTEVLEDNKEVIKETIENKSTENVVEANTATSDSTAANNVEEVKEEKLISNGDTAESNSAPAQENLPEKTNTDSSKVEAEKTLPEPQENITTPDEKVDEASNNDENKVVEEKEQKEPVPATTEVIESKESVPEDAKVEKESEKQVNGKATNSNGEVNVNGGASKDEELNARLSVDNGKEIVNGSNGDSTPGEKQSDKVETEISDIKVKSVPSDEPRTDPIEQPTEA